MTGGRYSIFYVADKLEPAVKDYLEVKPQITQLLQRQAKQDVVTKWIDARKKKVDINVDKDALWSTIDVDKYHATAPTEAQKPGS